MAKFCYILSLILVSVCNLTAQTNDIKFEHLTTQDGLSSNIVTSVIQDQNGYMWFGTLEGGLNKYDGYKFTVYKNIPEDSTSLSANRVEYMHIDHKCNIWIGTKNYGLCRYNPQGDNFIRYINNRNNPSSLSAPTVTCFLESDMDDKKVLWVGTTNGVNKYLPETDNFKCYYPDENKEGLRTNVNNVYRMTQDSSKTIWIATPNEGLYYLNQNKDQFIKFNVDNRYESLFDNKNIVALGATREGTKNVLWIGKYGEFLYKIYPESGKVQHFQPQNYNTNNRLNNIVYFIKTVDGSGGRLLWLGTNKGGLYRFDTQSENFSHMANDPDIENSLNSNIIYEVMTDRSGILWIAASGGLNKLNPLKSIFTAIKTDIARNNGLNSELIRSICEEKTRDTSVIWVGTDNGIYKFKRGINTFTLVKDKSGNSKTSDDIITLLLSKYTDPKYLWAGTYNGLIRIDTKTESIKRYDIPNKNVGYNVILSLCEDETGDILVGTYLNYLYRFDPQQEKFFRYPELRGHIYCMWYDSFGILWTGSGKGLEKFHIQSGKSEWYKTEKNDISSLSNRTVTAIFEDKDNNIWVGTYGGLNKYDRTSKKFTRYTEKDGLSSDIINAILQDELGNLWISTGKGISKFNPRHKTITNFEVNDGLHGNEFAYGSACLTESGEMLFGGKNGFTIFNPKNVSENKYIPPVVLTDFQIFNESVRPGNNSFLRKHISETKEIRLPYDQFVFSFEFAALDYHNPQKNQYSYQMAGVDPDWVYTNASRRFATYTNLDPGAYTFSVKGSNSAGIWNKEATCVRITVLPPWWQTNLAYFMYMIIISTIIFTTWHFQMKRIRIKHQLEMEHRVAEQYQEIDRIKSRFFANISHEFRTPLTLILSPIEQLISENFKGNIKEGYVTIRSNARKLLRLVNQLLSLSKLEAGQMQLQVSEQDIIPVLKRIINLFSSLAERRNIEFNVNIPESLMLYFDEDKIETVLNNLLSNAFKFTPEDGEVEVTIEHPPNPLSKGELDHSTLEGGVRGVLISVSNTGSYIPEDQTAKIFDRFCQMESNNNVQGTGIGLSLAKDLVELHHGMITVHSKKGEKTTFSIFIPSEKDSYHSDEIIDSTAKHRESKEIQTKISFADTSNETDQSVTRESPKVLIVEDNEEVRHYLKNNLRDTYYIFEAANGQSGLQIAQEELPDLIISDVMMPEMDGFALCNTIKSESLTSHIPVILLTARAAKEDKLRGLKTGADDYLPKPFDVEELLLRIENLIELRKGLKERFLREALFGIEKIASHPAEKQFVENVVKVVNGHLDNSDYSVELFAQELGMSRAQLFRKIKSWTNQTPQELIRTCRLKKAAELLKSNNFNVTEAAFSVGFKSLSHFTRSFEKQFGKSPKEFIPS